MADKLQLQVILDAIDKATGPIKKVMEGSKGLAKAVKDAKDRLKELDKVQGQIEGFRKLSKDAAITNHQFLQAQARVKALSQAMEQADKPTKAMARELEAAKKAAGELKGKNGELAQQLQHTRSRLKEAGVDTHQLSQRQTELKAATQKATETLHNEENALARVNARLKSTAAARASFEKSMAFRDKAAGAGTSLSVAGAATALPILKMVKDYSSFEQAMLGVARQVQGARDDNGRLTPTYFEMADGIKAMAERIPMATTEIAALVEAAARMGIQGKNDLLTFAETTAITATAFDLPVEKIGEDMGKLSALYKIPISNVKQLGDVINWLDDNALAKGGDIIDVMQRIAGTAATVNMSWRDAGAMASTFLSLGAAPEVAATASNAMIRELSIATMQSKRFMSGLDTIGLDPKKVQSSMTKDATGTILKVMDIVNKLPQNKQLEVMTKLFGKEYGDDAAKLAQNVGEYRRQLELANTAASKGSMMRESQAKNDTLAAQFQMVQNRLFNESSQLGNALRQPLMEIMNTINGVLAKVTAWTKANPELAAALMKTAAAVAAILAILGALTLTLAAILGPLAVLRYSVALLGINFGAVLSGIAGFGRALLAFLPSMATLKAALSGIGTALLWLARLAMAHPIIALISLLAMGALYIWRNWDTLGPKFAALWGRIHAGMVAAWNGIMAYFAGIKERFMAIGGAIIDGLKAGIEARYEAIRARIAGIASSIAEAARGALGIKSPSRVFAEIGAYTMQGLALGLAGNRAPFETVQKISRQLAGAGAGLAIASAPMSATASPMGAAVATGGGYTDSRTIIFQIYQTPGESSDDLVKKIELVLDKRKRRNQHRIRARLSDAD